MCINKLPKQFFHVLDLCGSTRFTVLNDHCYFVETSKKLAWSGAKSECSSYHSHLVALETLDEYGTLLQYLNSDPGEYMKLQGELN